MARCGAAAAACSLLQTHGMSAIYRYRHQPDADQQQCFCMHAQLHPDMLLFPVGTKCPGRHLLFCRDLPARLVTLAGMTSRESSLAHAGSMQGGGRRTVSAGGRLCSTLALCLGLSLSVGTSQGVMGRMSLLHRTTNTVSHSRPFAE